MSHHRIDVLCDEGGDWTALYVDGVKKRENHSLNWQDALEALGIGYTRHKVPSDPYAADAYPDALPTGDGAADE